MPAPARVVPLVAFVALLATGCGADDSGVRTNAPSTAQVTEAPSTSADRAPSAQQLEEMLIRAVSPNVPLDDKIMLVQGAGPADAPLFGELVKLRQDNPKVSWHIGTPVLEQPGLAKAQFSVLMDGTNQLAYATLVFDGDRWKLQRSYACQMITQVGRSSPSCP
ncbi:hypothetical protein GCM10027289_05540 [Tsukamurella serpentis]